MRVRRLCLLQALTMAAVFLSAAALLVAGGANFPDRMPWDGGTKVWHDAVYALGDRGKAPRWRETEPFPGRPRIRPVAAAMGEAFYLSGEVRPGVRSPEI